MKPVPKNWTRFSSAVNYTDANKAIDWLCEAFGFEVRLKVEGDGGILVHSELVFGDGLLMVGDTRSMGHKGWSHQQSPAQIGGVNTQSIQVYVDDVLAHCERARKAGATITMEPKVSDYGEEFWADRSYECRDHEGHTWWFTERLRSSETTPPSHVKH